MNLSRWKYLFPSLLPFLFYAPFGFFFALSYGRGLPGAITRVSTELGISGWWIIGAFVLMAFLSLLPFGWRYRAWCMLPLGAYTLLSAYLQWRSAHDIILALQGVYTTFIIIYPVMAAIAMVNTIHEQNELIERKSREMEFQHKRLQDMTDILQREGLITNGTTDTASR